MFWSKDIESTYMAMRFKEDVRFIGRIPSAEVNKVIGSAEALLFPSILEGFGIPIVEAFRCGTAVITSNITSMPEVAGDAALLVDPFSAETISDAMHRIINEPELRAGLIAKGDIRKGLFTWDKTAEGLWSSVLKTVNQ
jgi:glycosyltransferase involved in cell wall biosynthesis